MPILVYRTPDGREIEDIVLAGGAVKDTIQFPDGSIATRVPTSSNMRFRGEFSGGTTSEYMFHKDDGSEFEPGRAKDIANNRKYNEEKHEKELDNCIAESLNDFPDINFEG